MALKAVDSDDAVLAALVPSVGSRTVGFLLSALGFVILMTIAMGTRGGSVELMVFESLEGTAAVVGLLSGRAEIFGSAIFIFPRSLLDEIFDGGDSLPRGAMSIDSFASYNVSHLFRGDELGRND